jgi:hypothetical protein
VRLESDEQRWQTALKSVGRDELLARLARYPGGTEDRISNLPLEPPYPSREFCRQWCMKADDRSLKSSFNLAVVMALLGLAGVCFVSCTVAGLLNPSPTRTPNSLATSPISSSMTPPPPTPTNAPSALPFIPSTKTSGSTNQGP